jgi:hypothetical protein
MLPPLDGLTDQVTEPAWGLLDENEAVNVIVVPAATLADAGITEILTEFEDVEEEEEEGGPLDVSRQPPRPIVRQSATERLTKVNRESISGALLNSTLRHLPGQAKTEGKSMSMHRWYW